jgi:uncharacterized protein
MLIPRSQIERDVRRALDQFPAVALLGARQVGKTTLARQFAAARKGLYLDLENAADLRKLDDPQAFLSARQDQLVVIDEVHRVPALFPQLRGLIDARRSAGGGAGQFLLLGSASLDLMQQASESLAGRIAYLDMPPVQVEEAAAAGYFAEQTWLRGGFPLSLTAPGDEASYLWRQAFIRSYLERDVPMFAPRMPAVAIGRLWQMLATAQGNPLNQSRFAQSLGVTQPTISRYVDLLSDLMMVRRLQPWSGNLGKRLVKTPKIYLRDSGLMHALLEIGTLDHLLGHVLLGASWEGFVIESLITACGPGSLPYFYRTADGAELDLVIQHAGSVALAIEIKRSSAPQVSASFLASAEALDARRRLLVHGGKESWTGRGGTEVLCLSDALQAVRGATAGPFSS